MLYALKREQQLQRNQQREEEEEVTSSHEATSNRRACFKIRLQNELCARRALVPINQEPRGPLVTALGSIALRFRCSPCLLKTPIYIGSLLSPPRGISPS